MGSGMFQLFDNSRLESEGFSNIVEQTAVSH